MKKFVIAVLILLSSSFATAKEPLKQLPVYTDDIPLEYINKVQKLKNVNLKQTLPVYNTENMFEVKIHSKENIIIISTLYRNDDGVLDLKQNININDIAKFVVAQDVIKNNKIYIKQGTEVTGVYREARIGKGAYGAPDEIQISLFSTKDVSGNKVELYGSVEKEGKETGLFQMLPFFATIPSVRATILPKEIFTLYCN